MVKYVLKSISCNCDFSLLDSVFSYISIPYIVCWYQCTILSHIKQPQFCWLQFRQNSYSWGLLYLMTLICSIYDLWFFHNFVRIPFMHIIVDFCISPQTESKLRYQNYWYWSETENKPSLWTMVAILCAISSSISSSLRPVDYKKRKWSPFCIFILKFNFFIISSPSLLILHSRHSSVDLLIWKPLDYSSSIQSSYI